MHCAPWPMRRALVATEPYLDSPPSVLGVFTATDTQRRAIRAARARDGKHVQVDLKSEPKRT